MPLFDIPSFPGFEAYELHFTTTAGFGEKRTLEVIYRKHDRRVIRHVIIGPGILVPKGVEPPHMDFGGGQIPNTFNAHYPTSFQGSDGNPIVPTPLTHESTTPDTCSVVPDADPTAGFTVMTVDGAIGPYQIKITYGDASAEAGVQTAVAFLNGEVTSEVFVSAINIGAAELAPKV